MDLRTPLPGTSMLPSVAVAVELLLLGADGDRLTYRAREQALGDDDHPDGVARRLAGFDGSDPGRVLHSTSWRFAEGRIVLTYAGLPDPEPETATALDPGRPALRGGHALAPSPEAIAQADVVAHACRHLAFLHVTDPVVAEAAGRHPALWALIDSYRPGIAGRFDEQERLHPR